MSARDEDSSEHPHNGDAKISIQDDEMHSFLRSWSILSHQCQSKTLCLAVYSPV
jgi:hypothetical protein